MRNLLIVICLGVVAWAGFDLYEDGQFDMPDRMIGFANYGLGLGVSLGVAEHLKVGQ